MALDPNIKDNLTLMGEGNSSRRTLPLLVVLGVVLVASIVLVTYSRCQRRVEGQGPVAAPARQAASPKAQQRMLAAIKGLVASNAVEAAREKCREFLQVPADPAQSSEVEQILGALNVQLLLSQAAMPEKKEYIVRPGDTLERLARQHGTTVDLIRKCNAIEGKMIHPGDRLRIFAAPLSIVISKSANTLLLQAGGEFFKRYAVGTGKFGTTPAGTFVIADKIPEPPWWRPDGRMVPFGDKENVLGTRWLSLTATGETAKVRGYGIHGTWEPETIGKQASAGCVRLRNEDVEELFLIVPVGTSVTIVE